MRLVRAALLSLALLGAPAAQAAPALWEISDADSKIFLFGSVHLLPPGTDWRTPEFDKTLAEAQKVYFEADIGFFSQVFIVFQLVTTALNISGERWDQDLSAEDAARLDDALREQGMSLDQAQSYRPWFVSLLLQARGITQSGSYGPGVEVSVQQNLARERMAFLETASQQVAILSGTSDELQLRILLDALNEVRPEQDALGSIVDAWLNGDDEAMIGMVEADAQTGNEEMMKLLLADRNANWIAPIEALLAKNEQDLIIVGAAHLIGETGVVELLRARGYSIQRVQ